MTRPCCNLARRCVAARAWTVTRRAASALLGALLAAAAAVASADGGRAMPPDMPPAARQECAACHLAYPPGMLPAPSWQRLMGGLERHFGTDASLDAATTQQIRDWLLAHAGTGRRVGAAPPEDRITRSAWFERKHRGVDAAVWRLPSVKSPANCAACHAGAERGRFDDDELRLPAGLDARQRRAWND